MAVFDRVCEIRDSSNIIMVEYDSKHYTLRISFKEGSVYEYENVERSLFGDLVSWPSVGKFFQSYLRNQHDSKKIM